MYPDLKITLSDGAKVPERAHKTDAGLDLFANEEVSIDTLCRATISTGVKMAIPEGMVGFIKSRSGLAARQGIDAEAGVVDSGYRGEVKVCLANNGHNPIFIKKGMKIAQIVLLIAPTFNVEIVNELKEADRGDHGFGSTGV